MVDKDQADSCAIKKDNTPLLNCAKPDQDVKFTIKFQEFSPNLWGLEFQKNKDYYVICKFKISVVHSFKYNCLFFLCCLAHYKQTKKNVSGFVFFSLKLFSCQHIFSIIPDFYGASVSFFPWFVRTKLDCTSMPVKGFSFCAQYLVLYSH